jgi:hypothetical protein
MERVWLNSKKVMIKGYRVLVVNYIIGAGV